MDAMHDNLYCDDKDKDQVMTMIKDDGDGVLVMNDGLDELQKEAEKNSLRQYTKSHQRGGKPKVLNSARHGLSNIEGRFFDRKVTLNGFTIDEGLLYLEDYLKETPGNTTELLKNIKQQKTKLEWLLTNPLRTHVFTHLSANGQLTPDDIKHLTQAKLLKVLESYVVKREEKCRQTDPAEEHSAVFYRACLKHLLTNERTFKEQQTPFMSPYKVFLDKYKRVDLYAKENSYFKFGHEVLFEFFSVQGICQYLKSHPSRKKALLLHLCVNPNMRNVIQLLFSYITEYEPSLHNDLIFIAQACIILQIGHNKGDDTSSNENNGQHAQEDEKLHTQGNRQRDQGQSPLSVNTVHELNQLLPLLTLLTLPALIRKTSPAHLLDKSIDVEPVMSDIAKQIEAAFNENAEHLKAAGWFLYAGYRDLPMLKSTALLTFITGCLRQCSPNLQEIIHSQTIHKLIPTSISGRSICRSKYVYPMSGVRWGVVEESPIATFIYCWCPGDVASTLRQFYTHHAPQTVEHGVIIDLIDSASLWGAPPPELLSCNHWLAALHEVYNYKVDDLTLFADPASKSIPVDGLLQALQCVAIPKDCPTLNIELFYGQVSEEVLVSFCAWVHKVRHTVRHTVRCKVHLYDTKVLLSTECGEDYVAQLQQHIRHVLLNVHTKPTYETPTGRTVSYTM